LQTFAKWFSEFANHFPARYEQNKTRGANFTEYPFGLQISKYYQNFANYLQIGFQILQINICRFGKYSNILKIN